MRYIIDNYNQRIDARSGDQTWFQRWEAGLPALPSLINNRELCPSKPNYQGQPSIQGKRILFTNKNLKEFQNDIDNCKICENHKQNTSIIDCK